MKRSLYLILSLTIALITGRVEAGHGVALLVGGHDELARAFEVCGYVTTRATTGDTRGTVRRFMERAPTHGIALVYIGNDEVNAVDILELAREHSSAAFSIVIIEGTQKSGDIEDTNAVVYLGPKGFGEALVQQVNRPDTNLVPALQRTCMQTKAWTSATRETRVPTPDTPLSPPAVVREGTRAGDEWFNALGMVFCWCPTGSRPGFWLGKYELTKREFDLVTPKKPRHAAAVLPTHPRDSIRHDDILQFIDELNRRERFFERLPENWEYVLPTEEAWDYACRAGTDTQFYFGNDADQMATHANFADNRLFATHDDYYHYAVRRLDDGHARLAPVGSYPPNPWGFHDMYGNLWEWTGTHTLISSGTDTQGHPVACGGSWVSLPAYCGSDSRHQFAVPTERNFIGFRIALRKK